MCPVGLLTFGQGHLNIGSEPLLWTYPGRSDKGPRETRPPCIVMRPLGNKVFNFDMLKEYGGL